MWSYSENIWPNAQRNWPNARAFDELRSHLVTVGRIDQMRSAFGQMRSAIGQTLAHLAKRARNSPNVAHLVKCRTFDQLDKCAAHLAKCADWSNAPYNNTIVDTLVHSLYFVL